MPIHYVWLVQKRVMWGHITGKVTFQEIRQTSETLAALLEQVDTPHVHFIARLEDVEPTTDIRTLQESSRRLLGHPKFGWMIVYGQSHATVKFLLSVVIKLFGIKVSFVNSYGEAIRTLQQHDPNLPPLPADEPTIDNS